MNLRVSTDRKTANLASPNGKTAKIPNAFGLAAGREFSCPGATDSCAPICYAGKLERIFKGMRVRARSGTLTSCSASITTVISSAYATRVTGGG